MNELVRGLTNLRSLRAAVRELTLEQAENALEKLQTAIEEKRANEAELIKAETERKERLAKYKELMEKKVLHLKNYTKFLAQNCINSSKTCSTPCKICVY